MPSLRDQALKAYSHKPTRYLLIGGSSFVIDIGLLIILHGSFGLSVALSTTIGYWVSVVYNFNLHRIWTFGGISNKKIHQHLIPYSLLLAFNYLFTVIFVSFSSHHINYAVAKTLCVIMQTTWNYFIYNKVIFKA